MRPTPQQSDPSFIGLQSMNVFWFKNLDMNGRAINLDDIMKRGKELEFNGENVR